MTAHLERGAVRASQQIDRRYWGLPLRANIQVQTLNAYDLPEQWRNPRF